jgi:hypothetical protein
LTKRGKIRHRQIDPSSDRLIGAIASLFAFACVHESKIGVGLKCGFLVSQKFKASYLLNRTVKIIDGTSNFKDNSALWR